MSVKATVSVASRENFRWRRGQTAASSGPRPLSQAGHGRFLSVESCAVAVVQTKKDRSFFVPQM